jgi:uncharacterized protein (DUF1501 family)
MTFSITRRHLLRSAAAAAPLTVAGRAWAAPASDLRVLVVFLRGAYDALNVVVPTGASFYYESRPVIAVPKPKEGDAASAIALDAEWGLHPALRETLYPLWQKGEVAFVPFAGPADDLTRSHFETQDTIELGQSTGGTRDYRSGFMARLAASLTRARPIAFTDQVPLIFRGETSIPNVAIASVGRSGVDDRQAALIQAMYAGRPLENAVREGFQARDDVYRSVHAEMASDKQAVTPRGFELSARRIGRLMREQYNLAFVDVGGWDTHVNQGAATGYLADRIGELGRGLAGLAQELGPYWSRTVVTVVSEFGRTFRENGNRGTDHGHGSVYWVLGGPVKGGRIVGEQAKLGAGTLFQNRDLPVLTDYRALLGGLFDRFYGLGTAETAKLFPGSAPRDLGLV